MTTATASPLTLTERTSAPVAPRTARALRSVVGEASEVVAQLALNDPRWSVVGPRLTAFVDAARVSAGRSGSPIRSSEVAAPVLRLRDLARLAELTATSGAIADLAVVSALRSLQVAALR